MPEEKTLEGVAAPETGPDEGALALTPTEWKASKATTLVALSFNRFNSLSR
jgi:hypothetical protein